MTDNLLNINTTLNTATRSYIGHCFVICKEVKANALSITKNGLQHVWCKQYLNVDCHGLHTTEYEQVTDFPTNDAEVVED